MVVMDTGIAESASRFAGGVEDLDAQAAAAFFHLVEVVAGPVRMAVNGDAPVAFDPADRGSRARLFKFLPRRRLVYADPEDMVSVRRRYAGEWMELDAVDYEKFARGEGGGIRLGFPVVREYEEVIAHFFVYGRDLPR